MHNPVCAMHNRAYIFTRGNIENEKGKLMRTFEDHGVCLSSCMDYFEDDIVYQAFGRCLILAPEIFGNPWLLKDSEYPRLALTTFGVGLMKVIMSDKKRIIVQNYLVIPKQYYRWPFAGRLDALQYFGTMFFLAVAIAILSSVFLYHTKRGLNLRAVGENPGTADAAGINVTRYKYLATCIGAGISGLGGFYYIIDYMTSQEAYLSIEAFGWLSIALVIFVLWRPHLTIIGSFAFGVLFSCSSYLANMNVITIAADACAFESFFRWTRIRWARCWLQALSPPKPIS